MYCSLCLSLSLPPSHTHTHLHTSTRSFETIKPHNVDVKYEGVNIISKLFLDINILSFLEHRFATYTHV